MPMRSAAATAERAVASRDTKTAVEQPQQRGEADKEDRRGVHASDEGDHQGKQRGVAPMPLAHRQHGDTNSHPSAAQGMTIAEMRAM